jgi:hypothetical protein
LVCLPDWGLEAIFSRRDRDQLSTLPRTPDASTQIKQHQYLELYYMAIIRPSRTFAGSHFGDRFDPEPGDYSARLFEVQFTDGRKSHIQIQWELTNHPMSFYTWRIRRTYTLARQHIGFLNEHLWWWKTKKWEDLGEDDAKRVDTMRSWIGNEANIRVERWDPENPSPVSVTAVWSLKRSWPPLWDGDQEDLD